MNALWFCFSRKIPHSQRKRSEDDRGHHHADRSYRSCATQYVSARTENPVYTFRQRIYCISYFPRYRKSCFSHLLFSPAGRLPAYTEQVPLWKKSPSFCAALRNSVESDVYKYAALRKTKCVFYAFPRISGLFVPSNISRPDLRCSFSASWDCLLFPFF